MKALFVMNGITYGASGQPGVSGGDVILIEIPRRWVNSGVEVHFLTSSAGKDLCERFGLKVTYHISNSSSSSSIMNYVSLAFKATKEASSLAKLCFDVVYSSCEHVYDVLPALRLKRRSTHWVAMVHFVPPPPWTRVKAGGLNAVLYYLNHATGAYIVRFAADIVFAVSERTASDYVHKMNFDKRKVVSVPGGISYGMIRSIVGFTNSHRYDAIFMKRLQPMKGVFDLIHVWRRVVNVYPRATLLVIGEGPLAVVNRMKSIIKELNLVDNIEMFGPVYDMNEKFSLLASSKLFLLPSHEENWALVIGEALAAGLPVVVYDLAEIRDIWKNYVLWVPKGDMDAFATKVLAMLSNNDLYLAYANRGIEFMKQFDWDVIAENQLQICQKLL